ncbi:hypothetical protein AU468_10205 [Alkalispirochaeta sphaeroplastigenens]|uniref:histidine kinase n=1 Tax=Alkalispirochaeta sphaeroplastigenens TaxID=1187066 RepID=A0A2S4JJG1_9SPIO|nr:PAS domain S-box protein [Alkalispirochaeta sphaeroplastigenens]POQ99673.1 hypothetical protein AU468_10205 [Alkalispirochaeta sphaeroplastigenens]
MNQDDHHRIDLDPRLIEHIDDVIALVDEQALCRVVTPGITRTFGWSPQDILGTSLWKRVHPEYILSGERALQELIDDPGGLRSMEIPYLCKDGSWRWIELTAVNRLHEPDLNALVMTFRPRISRVDSTRSGDAGELRYETIVENQQDLVVKTDPSGKIQYANPAYCAIFGKPLGALQGESFLPQVHPDDQEMVQQKFSELLRDPYEISHQERNWTVSGWRWISWTTRALRDEEGAVFALIGAGRDVTEQQELEGALQESEVRYRELFAWSNDGVAVYRALEEGQDFILLDINRSGEEMDQVRREEVMGKRATVVFPGIDEFGLLDIFRTVWRTGVPASHPEKEFLRQGEKEWRSNYVYRLPSGEIVAIYQDITERKRARQAVEERERYLRSILRTTDDGFAVISPTGTLIRLNDAFCRIHGYSREELEGKALASLASDGEEGARQLLETVLERGALHYETQHRRKEGGLFDIEFSFSSLHEPTPSIIAFCRDITRRKQDESRIRALLQEKEMLLKEVHHRIKNNMTMMMSLLSLQAGVLRDPEAVSALEDAGSRLQTMAVLYDKLYRSESIEALSLGDYLPSLAEEVLETLVPSGRIEVRADLEEIVLEARTLSYLGIMVNELITNAVKHAFPEDAGGTISLEARRGEDVIEIVVADDGITMPSDVDLETSPGFGLSLLRALAQQLKGHLRIERGGGTRVILDIPLPPAKNSLVDRAVP